MVVRSKVNKCGQQQKEEKMLREKRRQLEGKLSEEDTQKKTEVRTAKFGSWIENLKM